MQDIQKLLDAKGWSQMELARQSGVSQGHISSIIRGEKQPTVTIIEKLATAFGMRPGELLDGDSGQAS